MSEIHFSPNFDFGVSPNGWSIQQLTLNKFSVQGPFNLSSDGNQIAYPV